MPNLSAVPANYQHYPKQGIFQRLLEDGDVTLKYYHLEKPGEPVPPALSTDAQNLLRRQIAEGFFESGDCGFVLLHRCGADFHFLLISVWRGANELWEAVWYHHGDMPAFAPFDPAYPAINGGPTRPVFCVWEMAIVAHEAAAWGRLLSSQRGDADVTAWRADLFEGLA